MTENYYLVAYILAAFLVFCIGIIKGWWYKKEEKWTRPKIKHNNLTKWNWMVSYPDRLTLGENTDIGAFTYIQAEYGVTIGKNVQIGSHCSIFSKNTIDNTHGEIIIDDNVKIGSHTTILPLKSGNALLIAHDSVIGAHSLVKVNIISNTTYIGVPAKKKVNYEAGL